ncbi:hypothetical protein AVEN_16365-1, partial [Araneus ventricosus]
MIFHICEISENKSITKTITRLRTSHFKGMRIHGHVERTYAHCSHCPETELSPGHIFEYPAILRTWQDVCISLSDEVDSDKKQTPCHALGIAG